VTDEELHDLEKLIEHNIKWEKLRGVGIEAYNGAMEIALREDFDPEGVHHLVAIMASAAILLDARTKGEIVDDRGAGEEANVEDKS
jgi:hypothetical protein